MKFTGKIFGIGLTILLLLVISGCAAGSNRQAQDPARQPAGDAADREAAVMDSFTALLQKKEVTVPAVIQFVDSNIANVSRSHAASLIIGLEQLQQEKLPQLEDQFSASEASQKILAKGPAGSLTDSFISTVDNHEVQTLLLTAKTGGFKVETAEGMYFPVIDYSLYKKYRNAVTPDIAAYIDIMAAEAEKTPVKDAALRITWAEVLQRAMTQERFIKEYGNSVKAADMRRLLQQYTAFAFYGANNTPLFSYDTGQMDPAAKQVYLTTAVTADNGSFSQALSGYLAVLNKNGYKLTAEVQEFRNKAMAEGR